MIVARIILEQSERNGGSRLSYFDKNVLARVKFKFYRKMVRLTLLYVI